jgi:hypothetical protein
MMNWLASKALHCLSCRPWRKQAGLGKAAAGCHSPSWGSVFLFNMRRKISYLLGLACLVFLVYNLNGLRHAMYREYGYGSVHAAIVKFMEKEKRWPRSWSELEPHYEDMFFGLKTTRFIRQHLDVAWHINPYALLEQEINHPPPEHALYDYSDNIIPVIYKIRKEQTISDSTTWILHPLTHHYFMNERER